MDSVLDNLFSILPVVIMILWVLRRFDRRRRGTKKSGDHASSSAEEPPQQAGRTGPITSLVEKITGAVRESAGHFPGEGKAAEAASHPERGSLKTVRPPARAPRPVEASTKRVLTDRAYKGDQVGSSGSEIVLSRINRLPPVAQGVLWSIILDKPVGMKDPEDR